MKRTKQNIIRLKAGSSYVRRDGTSRASTFENEFLKKHPNAKRYMGDLRSEAKHYSAVYKLMAFENTGRSAPAYPTLYTTYVEE